MVGHGYECELDFDPFSCVLADACGTTEAMSSWVGKGPGIEDPFAYE